MPSEFAPRPDMGSAALLSRLDGVRRTGPGRWVARCPAHDDGHASLSIRELDDGRVLLHDFAGCSVHEVLAAAGLDMAALFPPRDVLHGKCEARPFPAADILRCVAFEALVISCATASLLAGEPFSEADRARLVLAASRMQAALDAGGLGHA